MTNHWSGRAILQGIGYGCATGLSAMVLIGATGLVFEVASRLADYFGMEVVFLWTPILIAVVVGFCWGFITTSRSS